MKRLLLSTVAILAFTAAASAHFIYVLPLPSGDAIQVVFSDGHGPDKSVPISKIAGTTLTVRVDGKDQPIKLEQVENYLKGTVPSSGNRVVFGLKDYGVVQKGDAQPFRLFYHPKAVIGDAFAKETMVGEKLPVEIVPVRDGAGLKFHVISDGKPLADAEVFMLKPGAEKTETIKTDRDGNTVRYAEVGRYLVVARRVNPKPGEAGGKKYEEERHYATLTIDVK